MKVAKLLLENQEKIYNFFSSLNNISDDCWESCSEEHVQKYLSLDKDLEKSQYESQFRFVDIKNPPRIRFLKDILSTDLIKIFEHKDIYSVHYFEVWGNVLEHVDSKGRTMGYPCNDYNTFVMAVQVPSDDPKIFTTYYNKKPFKLQEGVFENWDVTNVPHYWTFDYKKCNKLFKWLRVDYIESKGLDTSFDSVYNSSVRRSDSISFF